MKNGNYVIYVGAEGSFDDGQQIPPSSPISLAGSAAAVLNFSYHMVNELRKEGHNVHEELRFVVGESRGGMIAEGIDALAEEFAQKVIFSDQIAPCLPEKLRGLAEALRLAEQIAKEPIEMYRLLGRLTMARLRYYPRTLDLRASNIYHQIIIGGALFGGETGYMSRHTPDTTLKHLLLFENDFASKHGWWECRYQENPLVHTTPMPGSHLTIADPETLRFVLARNTAAQLFVNSGKRLDTRVFDLSHLIVQHKEHALLKAA